MLAELDENVAWYQSPWSHSHSTSLPPTHPHPHQQLQFSQSSATQSTRSDVINLCSLAPTLTYEAACTAIARKFYDVHRVTKNRKVRTPLF